MRNVAREGLRTQLEAFRQRQVGEQFVGQLVHRHVVADGQRGGLDDLAAVVRQHLRTQQATAVGLGHELDEAAGIETGECPGHLIQVEAPAVDGKARCLRACLVQTDRGHLRVGEDDRRQHRQIQPRVAAGHVDCRAGTRGGHIDELLQVRAVTDGVDGRVGGPHPVIDPDRPARVRFDPDRSQAEIGGIGRAPGRDQQPVGRDGLAVERDGEMPVCMVHGSGLRMGQDADAFRFQRGVQAGPQVEVLAAEQRTAGDDRDGAAQAAIWADTSPPKREIEPATASGVLTLPRAEALALARDTGARALRSEAAALEYEATAARSLPDPTLILGVGAAATAWLLLGGGHDREDVEVDPEREVAYWVAPMDSSYRRDEPGESPMGMALVPVYADEVGEPGMVAMSAATRSALGVRLGEARLEALPRTVHAPGRVEFDETRRHHVHPRVSGWIEGLAVNETGQVVERGEPLFELYSPQLVSAQEELLQALRSGSGRAVDGARERLRALGVSGAQIDAIERDQRVRQRITIDAPVAGVVEQLNVADGMRVEPATAIMTITDRTSVWLIADVFPGQADWVAPGHAALVRLSDLPEREIETEVAFVHPQQDRRTRTVPVRLRLDNHDGTLRPGQFGSVRIDVPANGEVVTVPEQAVIRTGRQDRIAIARGEGRFEIRPVTIGMAAEGRREIRAGVDAGDRVVVSGQFLIDSEANVDAESERMAEADDVAVETEAEAEVEAEVFATSGEVVDIDRDDHSLTLDHEPVEALDWPRMTMGFAVADGVDLADLAVGETVDFEFRARDDGTHEVTAIRRAQSATDDEGGVEP